jgi:hypothetical protein
VPWQLSQSFEELGSLAHFAPYFPHLSFWNIKYSPEVFLALSFEISFSTNSLRKRSYSVCDWIAFHSSTKNNARMPWSFIWLFSSQSSRSSLGNVPCFRVFEERIALFNTGGSGPIDFTIFTMLSPLIDVWTTQPRWWKVRRGPQILLFECGTHPLW